MSDFILIPLAGIGTLRLEQSVFHDALVAAATPVVATAVDESWLTSQQLAEKTGIPDSWWEQAVKDGRVPAIRAGKYLRFKLSECEQTLRHADNRSATRSQTTDITIGKKTRTETQPKLLARNGHVAR